MNYLTRLKARRESHARWELQNHRQRLAAVRGQLQRVLRTASAERAAEWERLGRALTEAAAGNLRDSRDRRRLLLAIHQQLALARRLLESAGEPTERLKWPAGRPEEETRP